MSFASIVRDVVELLTNTQRRDALPDRSSSQKGTLSTSNTSATARDSQALSRVWVPPGKAVVVQGRRLPDGMIYVGSKLTGVSAYESIEPALIDPSLPVDNFAPDVDGDLMWYWPSYSELEPASRAAFLNWLAAGRPGGADIGYVFLFFYGIERRILFDTNPKEIPNLETASLISEIERLLELYPDNRSFNGYASGFLSFVKFMQTGLNFSTIKPPVEKRGWELPLELKIGLGHIVRKGNPIPAKWVLSWLRLHPESSFRTAAIRCKEEFDELLTFRYHQRHGSGMVIRPNKTKIKHSYRPASSSFSNSVELDFPCLPDVTRLKQPIRNIQNLAEDVTNELDSYSRWIGRYRDRDSLRAIALLPAELVRRHQSPELDRLNARIESALAGANAAVIEVSALVAGFPSAKKDRFSAAEAKTFVELVEKLGFGIEPDVRYSKINLTRHERVSIYRLKGKPSEPTARYHAATVFLHLGAVVATADEMMSRDETAQLELHLEQSLGLGKEDRTRLNAHLQWLLVEPPTLSRVKPRIEMLSKSDQNRITQFIITIAGVDGAVGSDEINVLSRIYRLLGLEDHRLHSDIHDLAIAAAEHPITVTRPNASVRYTIPSRPKPDFEYAERVELDPDRVARIMQDTQAVSDLLTEIFEGPADHEPSSLADDTPESNDNAVSTSEIGGSLFDHEHAQLVRMLSQRPTWSRTEVENFAADVGLMPEGAIETINNAVFAYWDGPLIEGDDLIEIDQDILRELLNAT